MIELKFYTAQRSRYRLIMGSPHLQWIISRGNKGRLSLAALLLLLGACNATTRQKDALNKQLDKEKITLPTLPSNVSVAPSRSTIRSGDNDKTLPTSSEDASLTPQELLDRKLNNPTTVLTPNQSITLLNYCAALGEQNAAGASEKITCLVLGNTGTGKSTTLNALLGCTMREERTEQRARRIVVDPSSELREVSPIGHGEVSRTFFPQIIPYSGFTDRVYCDCPGFEGNRGAEINIANAINIRKIVQQARGVKALFLAEYSDLTSNRGRSIQILVKSCHDMFGSVDNLRALQHTVLLGITKAPRFDEDGQPLSIDIIRSQLMNSNSITEQILAERLFLFDPLDRGNGNPDFWSLARCRNEIEQLNHIPQNVATTLFKFPLIASDHRHLQETVRNLRPQIVDAITQGDVATLSQKWQLLLRLRVIEDPEVEKLIKGDVLCVVNAAILQRAVAIRDAAQAYQFEDAQSGLNQLTAIISKLPGVPMVCDINGLQEQINACIAKQGDEEAFKEQVAKMKADLEKVRRELQQLEKEAY